jgi:hypothetical protein
MKVALILNTRKITVKAQCYAGHYTMEGCTKHQIMPVVKSNTVEYPFNVSQFKALPSFSVLFLWFHPHYFLVRPAPFKALVLKLIVP